MKARLSSLDVRAIANELDVRLANKYVQNFYSTGQRFMYVKFSNHDILLLEPGVCAHLATAHDTEISHFCTKLRARCRHARVRRIFQYSLDRVLVIDLGRARIVVEFFSGGNILILDADDTIVEILRPVPQLGIARGVRYVWNTVDIDLTHQRFAAEGLAAMLPFEKEFVTACEAEMEERLGPLATLQDETRAAEVEAYFSSLSARISSIGGLGEALVRKGNVEQLFAFPALGDRVLSLQRKAAKGVARPLDSKGPASATDGKDPDAADVDVGDLENLSLTSISRNIVDPAVVERINGITLFNREDIPPNAGAVRFPTMNEAVEFAFAERKKAPKVKRDKAERIAEAQGAYITELGRQAESYGEAAVLLEENRSFISEILMIFKRVYERRMKWEVFDEFWAEEKKRGNLHSLAIVSYDLGNRRAVINLGREEPGGQNIEITIDKPLTYSINDLYSKRRKALEKAERTKMAMEGVAQKLRPKKAAVKAQKRVPYWFERYNWFITSDKCLVLGGRNAQDNEALVKNRMAAGDLFFHCDVHGASAVICKGKSPETVFPESTLSEAAVCALVFSRCWAEGVIHRVFSVDASQVSKTAPSGEFLSHGGFFISGKKTFHNPYRLEYGIALLFRESGDPQGSDSADGAKDGVLDISLVGVPTGVHIIHAMPFCAPWSVVKSYCYRARLCPGNDKKSVVAFAVQKAFLAAAEGRPEESMVRAVGIDEYINVVVSKSKVAKAIN